MKTSITIQALTPRHVFRINNSSVEVTRNVFVRVEDGDGYTGYGEGAPSKFFGESQDEVHSKLRNITHWLEGRDVRSVADIGRIWNEAWDMLKPYRSAQAALDLALWDMLAKREGLSVAELASGERPRPIKTFVTIGLSDPEELKIKVAELRGFPSIKVKMDHGIDLGAVQFVREQTGAALAVDANRAWKEADLQGLSERLKELGVIFIEQPFPVEDDARMERILPFCRLPVIADESCATLDDIERMAGRYSGFNIKLSKCGGLTPALKMMRRGRELGLTVMVGCRLESSLSISAGAVIGLNADYADLDGAWLLRDDPFTGLPLQSGELIIPDAHGFGVQPREGMFKH